MDKPSCHILVCASFRADGDAKGVCNKKGSVALLPYIENEILDRGMDAQVTSTGCMKACDHGPVMVVHPKATGTAMSKTKRLWMKYWMPSKTRLRQTAI